MERTGTANIVGDFRLTCIEKHPACKCVSRSLRENFPVPLNAPTLYLHIGRNKAGSTTLQNHWHAHADALRRAGILYGLFGVPGAPESNLPSFPTPGDLADFVRSHADQSVLASHEIISCFPADVTRNMAAELAGLNIRVIFYVRPYRDWVLSSYSFDVRTGFNGLDFDRYFENIRPLVSFWPMLEAWGETIGWQNVRVRSLHPSDLQGGDLISDSSAALGVTLPARERDDRANASPSWIVIELLRMIADRAPAGGWSRDGLAIAEALHGYADMAIEAGGNVPGKAAYLTPGQADWLTDLYNRDLESLAERTGVSLWPGDPARRGERTLPPSAAHVPKNIIRWILRHALETDAALLHPEAAAFIGTAEFRRLAEG